MRSNFKSVLVFTIASALCTGAMAHTGHGTHSLMEGLEHPFGTDHLLAMLAVGIWSVTALPVNKAWQGPSTFMLALVVSATLGSFGVAVPFLEHTIALSVTLFGAMLILATRPLPEAFGLRLIAVAASLHGLAHGSEAPATSFTGYAVGFLLTTAALHIGGVGIGLGIRRWMTQRNGAALASVGTLLGFAGIYLFSQI
jgi:urease accessory protein